MAANGDGIAIRTENLTKVEEAQGRIAARTLDVASQLPGIFQALEEAGATVADVSLRRNTLDDVFISLTGRKRRE
jgi:hypothetical protein